MTMNTRPSYGSHRPDGYPQQDELPVGYLQRGYFDEKGNLLPQVLEDWPQKIAQNLFHANPKMTFSCNVSADNESCRSRSNMSRSSGLVSTSSN